MAAETSSVARGASLEADPAGGPILVSGRLDGAGVGQVWLAAASAIDRTGREAVRLDASGVDYCDGAGAAFLVAMEQRAAGLGGNLTLSGLREEFSAILGMIEPAEPQAAPDRGPGLNPIAALGAATRDFGSGLRELVAYVGELVVALFSVIRHPRQLRFNDVMLVAERAGIGALPIVTLIGFLLGLILSFQSAIPMRRFGAEIFVADLLGISLLRELGPLMAAIMLTARSGSAFAAEIGTMKVNEEVDALTTMGLDPMRFLILPRVVAAVMVVPVLAMMTNLAGLLGGAIMFSTLGFPFVTFVSRVVEATSVGDFIGGIFKAFVFGVIVAAVGCQRGLGTGKGAGAVGLSTTSSVVTGITLIALVDGIFAVAFYVMGI
jgi:phospholipid/cholesterol/gamma-HCH transport system permease protein